MKYEFSLYSLMRVEINIRKSTPKKRLTGLWFRFSLILAFWSFVLLIAANPYDVSLAQTLGPQSYVFAKALPESDPSELNQNPPVAERATPFVDKRIEPLREYLAAKKSPLAPYAEDLVNHYHYRLIIGIAFAESNFCKKNIKPHNCWGIGGGNPTTYQDYPQAISRADYYIQKYFDDGLTDLNRFRNRWVGWQHPGWPTAVERVARELEEKGI